MTKPKWVAQAPYGYKLCLNCQWRLAEVIEPARERHRASQYDYCRVCSAALGSRVAAPVARRLPELPPRTRSARDREPAIKERLAAIGAIPTTCANCGWSGHTSADCPGPKPEG